MVCGLYIYHETSTLKRCWKSLIIEIDCYEFSWRDSLLSLFIISPSKEKDIGVICSEICYMIALTVVDEISVARVSLILLSLV